MKLLTLALILIAGTAYAETGHIECNVVSDIATISQDENGIIKVSANVLPLYCATDASGTMCFY